MSEHLSHYQWLKKRLADWLHKRQYQNILRAIRTYQNRTPLNNRGRPYRVGPTTWQHAVEHKHQWHGGYRACKTTMKDAIKALRQEIDTSLREHQIAEVTADHIGGDLCYTVVCSKCEYEITECKCPAT